VEDDDGNILVAGYFSSMVQDVHSRPFLIKLNSKGEILYCESQVAVKDITMDDCEAELDSENLKPVSVDDTVLTKSPAPVQKRGCINPVASPNSTRDDVTCSNSN
jgi:hypothetical protein